MDLIIAIIIAASCLIVGVATGYAIFRYALTKEYDAKMKEAELEAETLKKNKQLEVKEKLLLLRNLLQGHGRDLLQNIQSVFLCHVARKYL